MKLQVTPGAKAQIERLLPKTDQGRPALRLAVVATGCMGGRGHAYEFGPSQAKRADDASVEAEGFVFHVDARSQALLGDVHIDVQRRADAVAFQVENSRTVAHCPCGRHDLFEAPPAHHECGHEGCARA